VAYRGIQTWMKMWYNNKTESTQQSKLKKQCTSITTDTFQKQQWINKASSRTVFGIAYQLYENLRTKYHIWTIVACTCNNTNTQKTERMNTIWNVRDKTKIQKVRLLNCKVLFI
jgi:hypothetical protein